MTTKEMVLVSKKWNNPTIVVGVTEDGIKILMNLDEFLGAVILDMGSPALLLTKAQLKAALLASAANVREEMHNATAVAVSN
jgi:hypothetical protein